MLFPGKCLFLSGLIPRPMNADNDRELIGLGIGFTNIVERTTRASQELTRQEIEEGELVVLIVIFLVLIVIIALLLLLLDQQPFNPGSKRPLTDPTF